MFKKILVAHMAMVILATPFAVCDEKNFADETANRQTAVLKQDIIKFMEVQVAESVIVKYVQEHPLPVPLSADDIIEWKKAGISDAVIQAVRVDKDRKSTEEKPADSKQVTSASLTLKKDTRFLVRFQEKVKTQKLRNKAGSKIQGVVVAENVELNGSIIIEAGAPVDVIVLSAQSGVWRGLTELTIEAISLTARDGTKIPIKFETTMSKEQKHTADFWWGSKRHEIQKIKAGTLAYVVVTQDTVLTKFP